ncbi:MAG: hypothetical protein Q9162_003069 [Coniocarpon cinnabarinum]
MPGSPLSNSPAELASLSTSPRNSIISQEPSTIIAGTTIVTSSESPLPGPTGPVVVTSFSTASDAGTVSNNAGSTGPPNVVAIVSTYQTTSTPGQSTPPGFLPSVSSSANSTAGTTSLRTPGPPLSGGAIAGIVVGVLVLLTLLIALILYNLRTRKRLRTLHQRVSTLPEGTMEKAELPAKEAGLWQRMLGSRGNNGELPSQDETKIRAELEESKVEPAEMQAEIPKNVCEDGAVVGVFSSLAITIEAIACKITERPALSQSAPPSLRRNQYARCKLIGKAGQLRREGDHDDHKHESTQGKFKTLIQLQSPLCDAILTTMSSYRVPQPFQTKAL